jgi:hypothetical protein
MPHTSHLLQPLDVGVFHAYKNWHSEAVANASHIGGGKFIKICHELTPIQVNFPNSKILQPVHVI